VAAKRERELHETEFELFSRSIPSSTRDEWLAMITLWESDPAKPNPYVVVAECTLTLSKFGYLYSCMCGVKTQAEVRLELIEMEKTILVPGGTCDETSATSLLMAAFDIEDAQYVA
jgi:hypothetical protein